MHPQLLCGLLLAVILGTSMAFVLPDQEPSPQDTTKVTNVDSDPKTNPASTPIYYYRSPDWSAQPSRNKENEEGAQETHFAYISDGTKIKARERSTQEHGGIYRRDGGSNNTIIIVVAVLVGLLFVGIAVITWRKCHGY
ncbi:hypothetical protein QBC45DRAFT_471753 [Copromyces sp. CBS 386.78]|nr:hypothetical protein QBC45DRAFT_471753 [Copromyces sp. CBS 386.78]